MPENLIPPTGAGDTELHVQPVRDALSADPNDPDAVRGEIQQTRARMSSTIDELEAALLRKKEQIQERLDVLAPARERPLLAVGAVFAAGLALGLLTGGDPEAKPPRWFRETVGEGDDLGDWRARAEGAERRLRRLERTIDAQDRELRRLRKKRAARTAHYAGYDPYQEDAAAGSRALGESLRGLRDMVADGVAGAVHGAFRHRRAPREVEPHGTAEFPVQPV